VIPGEVILVDSGTGSIKFDPEQTFWGFGGEAGNKTNGFGLTEMVKLAGVPGQVAPALEKEGVTVMLAVTIAVVLLVAVKEAMSPVPLAGSPMDVLLFVQL
jgi:hypothetical protein